MDAASYDSVLALLQDERAELLALLGALDVDAWAGLAPGDVGPAAQALAGAAAALLRGTAA